MADLMKKHFVLVPAGAGADVEALKTASLSNGLIYFIVDTKEIVAKGEVFGATAGEIERIEALEGYVGTPAVEADPENGIDGADATGLFKMIEDLEAGDAAKIENSKTLEIATDEEGNESIETAVAIKYVDAVPAQGEEGEEGYVAAVPAHIALVDKDDNELSIVEVSDLVANGLLKSTEYDSTTGQLTLTFAQADGSEKNEVVDLKKMLDIDDVLIADDSKDYLDVALDGGENADAVFSAKIVKMADAVAAKDAVGAEGDDDYQPAVEGNTGLADAADVKSYIDAQFAALRQELAEFDPWIDYVAPEEPEP